MRHVHNFKETRRTYAPAVAVKSTKGAMSSEQCRLVERMIFGVTTVETTCATCGEIRINEALGDAR